MEYTLKLSQHELIAALNALSELPLKVGFNAFVRLQQQMQEQDAANAIEETPDGI